ncbi:uncharacterized protein HMPREF1541_03997 [Cyphellophora europaea CBS 101466]|uniref:LYC1 C-terminal domain-containing protein n=1 Tax=Cyphellophora europaea (strain CBS 101466) TaxID=1220924 RepID=W2S1Y2_CYPE1|nr:uncharacterized protein HMPREF1541_03997 [Cyphellophora europaea CBS 101466]ETN42058.1 hypothetical protein HMPREF1541_03997 [Cyphellophora europaea CBS 101466]
MAIPAVPNGDTVVEKPVAVDPSQLPSSKSSDVRLVQATLSEHIQCSRLNAEEWRGPLTIEQYLKREKHLMAQELTKDGKEVPWILTDTSLPADEHGNRAILASCETIPTRAYVARDGKVDTVLIHGIGSVFTRPEHRGKSYASRMMTELGKTLDTFQQPNGHRSLFSVLYSDIGQNFYSRFGWQAFPSTHIRLGQMSSATYQTASEGLPSVQDLTSADLRTIPAKQYVQDELQTLARTMPGVSLVAVAPSVEHFEWHHAREEFVSKALGRSLPQTKGAIHEPTGVAVIWSRTFAAEKSSWTLHILHVAVPPSVKGSQEGQAALAALLLRAQHEACRSETLTGVEVWDPSEDVIAAAQSLQKEKGDKIEIIHRDQDHICSLRWIGPEPAGHRVDWRFTQKYAWC